MFEEKVLFVDDDPNILEAYQRQLRKTITVNTALGGHEGLESVRSNDPYAVVISDYHMPGMNGVEFLNQVREHSPLSVRIMLTGNSDIHTAVQAVNEGNIFRFLTKPCHSETLGKALIAAINQYRLLVTEKELTENTLNGSISLLTEILSIVNPDAFGRANQLREAVRALLAHLNISDTWEIELAAMLSQIGLVAAPPEIVAKHLSGEPLSSTAQSLINRFPEIGSDLIRKIPRLSTVADIVLYQTKNFDGSGFPEDSVAGCRIPFGARVLRVMTDVVDAELQAIPREQISTSMNADEGKYDPVLMGGVVDAHFLPETQEDVQHAVQLEVDLCQVRIGDALVRDVETNDAKLLIASGNIISQMMLTRLLNHHKIFGVKEPVLVKRVAPMTARMKESH